jgi:hypothetical protein
MSLKNRNHHNDERGKIYYVNIILLNSPTTVKYVVTDE